jgi:TPR repeat protein
MPAKARSRSKRAAQQDQRDAQVSLAELLLRQHQGEEGERAARFWLERAAGHHSSIAKLMLAGLLASSPDEHERDAGRRALELSTHVGWELSPLHDRLALYDAHRPFAGTCSISGSVTRAELRARALHARCCRAIGRRRTRLPVAANTALQRAGATGGTAASPIPPGGSWLSTR